MTTVNSAFERLKNSVEEAVRELDMPYFLADSVLEIARNPQKYESKATIVNDLADMVLDFHTYAEACCERLGASVQDIEYVVDYIKSSINQSSLKQPSPTNNCALKSF